MPEQEQNPQPTPAPQQPTNITLKVGARGKTEEPRKESDSAS